FLISEAKSRIYQQNVVFFPVVGINAFSLSLIGFLISEAKSRIYQQNVVFFTLMVGIAFLINNFVTASWLLLFHQLPLIPTFTDSLYPSLLYTCALCSLIFFIGGKQTKLSIPQS
ncbi:rod shape-determining protein MreD, partial [Candidatus Aerophobetes bacterium]|nr:rod shape-determining protein MreD [Candidatus Aerophobetes bacterium]